MPRRSADASETLFVVGNDPPAGRMDKLLRVPTIALDGAYLAWTALGRHPTHYCCVDDALIEAHHAEISAMVREGCVESALLTKQVLRFHPELAHDPRCVLLESVRAERAFRMEAGAPLSSAACAARYAISLGHHRIRFVGVACDEPTQLEAMTALREDVGREVIAGDIRNCTESSALVRHGVFPFEDLERALGLPLLGAVAVPMTFREEDALTANLERWSSSEYAPLGVSTAGRRVPLVIVLNGHRDLGFESRVRETFVRQEGLGAAFAGPEFEYCELDRSQDIYIRDYSQPAPSNGYKAGPNAQFFRSMELLRPYGRYAFMMETDCLPIRPGWLSELERVVAGNDPFWILGSLYRGVGPLNERWRLHVNGNAVYAVGDAGFQGFIEEEWRPALEGLLPTVPTLAYDCVLPLHFTEGGVAPDGRKWELYQDVAHLFRTTDFIQNHAGQAEVERGEGATLEEIRGGSPHTYVVHGRHLFPPPRAERAEHEGTRDREVVEPEPDPTPAVENGSQQSGSRPAGFRPAPSPTNGGAPELTPDAPSADGRQLPRVLVLDSTRVGALNATGQLKKNLLAPWPEGGVLQLWMPTWDEVSLASSIEDPSQDVIVTNDEALEAVDAFGADVVYYRPTIDTHGRLQALSEVILDRHPVPLVTHIVDDWPSRLAAQDPVRGTDADRTLRAILARSHSALSISDGMSAAFSERYGHSFEAIANGIDLDRFREASARGAQIRSVRDEVVIRYCGGLAKDMSFDTVVQVARATAIVSEELPVRFEVYTMPHWRPAFEDAVAELGCVSVLPGVPDAAYPALLAEADILVLGYNFDPASLRYIRYSMPNKLPEYLGSGAPVLAVGPRDANGIDYLLSRGLGCCVTEPDLEILTEALRCLASDGELRQGIGSKGQAWAFERCDLEKIATRFQEILTTAAAARPEEIPELVTVGAGVAIEQGGGPVSGPMSATNGGDPGVPSSPAGSGGQAEEGQSVASRQHEVESIRPVQVSTQAPDRPTPPSHGPAPTHEAPAERGSKETRYDRLYLWARKHQLVFAAGRLAMWFVRKVRRYPLATVGFAAALIALVVVGLEESGTYGALALGAACLLAGAGLLVAVVGFSRFMIKESRHELELQHLSLRRRVERAEQLLTSESRMRGALAAQIESVGSTEQSARAELAARLQRLEADRDAALHKMRALEQASVEAGAELDALRREADSEFSALKARYEGEAKRMTELQSAHESRWKALTSLLDGKADHDQIVALEGHVEELASTLRADTEARLAALASDYEVKSKELEARLLELAAGQETERRRLAAELGRMADREVTTALEGRLDSAETSQQAIRSELERRLALHVSEFASESARTAGALAAIEARLEEVGSALADRRDRLSFDIVSALRQIHEVWAGGEERGDPDLEAEKEHGHVVLMALIAEAAKRRPDALRGRTLIEIGTTREHDPHQGSTEKLAIFSGLLGMRFVSVDMDPLNTDAANEVVPYLNPGAQAVTARGESFLAETEEPLEYVYLDAFDFDHGQHSEERKSRYREVLHTEISDEACWQMHELCASALVTRMGEDGIVVIDDTWLDEAGEFAGKGRRAVPLLLASGFSVVTRTPRAVALRRVAAPASGRSPEDS